MTEKLLAKLREISLFQELKTHPEALEAIVKAGQIVEVKKDQVIFLEDDVGNSLYIPLSGSYEILKKTRAGDTYTVSKLDGNTPVFFGEMALIDDDRRSATVAAASDGDCFVLYKDHFDRFAEQNPRWALSIIREISKTLAARLRRTTADMLTLFDALVEEIKG